MQAKPQEQQEPQQLKNVGPGGWRPLTTQLPRRCRLAQLPPATAQQRRRLPPPRRAQALHRGGRPAAHGERRAAPRTSSPQQQQQQLQQRARQPLPHRRAAASAHVALGTPSAPAPCRLLRLRLDHRRPPPTPTLPLCRSPARRSLQSCAWAAAASPRATAAALCRTTGFTAWSRRRGARCRRAPRRVAGGRRLLLLQRQGAAQQQPPQQQLRQQCWQRSQCVHRLPAVAAARVTLPRCRAEAPAACSSPPTLIGRRLHPHQPCPPAGGAVQAPRAAAAALRVRGLPLLPQGARPAPQRPQPQRSAPQRSAPSAVPAAQRLSPAHPAPAPPAQRPQRSAPSAAPAAHPAQRSAAQRPRRSAPSAAHRSAAHPAQRTQRSAPSAVPTAQRPQRSARSAAPPAQRPQLQRPQRSAPSPAPPPPPRPAPPAPLLRPGCRAPLGAWHAPVRAPAPRLACCSAGAPVAAARARRPPHPPPPRPASRPQVREAVSVLDLDVLVYPCPKDGPTWRPKAVELGGKAQFPYLVDPNSGRWAGEGWRAGALEGGWGAREPRGQWAWAPATAWLGLCLSWGTAGLGRGPCCCNRAGSQAARVPPAQSLHWCREWREKHTRLVPADAVSTTAPVSPAQVSPVTTHQHQHQPGRAGPCTSLTTS